jgi:hypothetical protein
MAVCSIKGKDMVTSDTHNNNSFEYAKVKEDNNAVCREKGIKKGERLCALL